MKRNWKSVVVMAIGAVSQLTAEAAEFQKLGKAVATALGSTKASKRTVSIGGKATDVFTLKSPSGAAERYAFVERGIYQPNCTHTWVVGVDAKTSKVSDIQVVEMSCPHAFPTKEASFLSQYKGKGPAELKTLSSSVMTVAKATGSAELTTKAVERAIQGSMQLKGK
jgi:hypothetical protein